MFVELSKKVNGRTHSMTVQVSGRFVILHDTAGPLANTEPGRTPHATEAEATEAAQRQVDLLLTKGWAKV